MNGNTDIPNRVLLAVKCADYILTPMAGGALGHAAGDELICGAANIIDKVFGSYGLCFRTGGDEYIVLARTDRLMAEELIYQLIKEADAWNAKLIHQLSLSAGYALAADHEGVSAEKLIVFADKGMYSEKNRYYASLKSSVKDTRLNISNKSTYKESDRGACRSFIYSVRNDGREPNSLSASSG